MGQCGRGGRIPLLNLEVVFYDELPKGLIHRLTECVTHVLSMTEQIPSSFRITNLEFLKNAIAYTIILRICL